LAKLCLSDKRIAKVWIKIIKPTALPNVSAVGVEIERERD
jgi:dihydroneopterin aldolase